MSTVDEILASGEYTDRRGRYWHLCDCTYPPCNLWHQHHPSAGIGSEDMRLLIERDLHRDVCPGLRRCMSHPVPWVVKLEFLFGPDWWGAAPHGGWFVNHAAAMAAARALAVNP